MKKQNKTILAAAALLAGGYLLHRKRSAGVGEITMPHAELNAFLNSIAKPCNKMVNAWWASLNKQNRLVDYLKDYERRDEVMDRYWNYNQWKELKYGHWQRAECVRQLDFTPATMREYQALANMLMSDFDVFVGMGGSNNDDPRIQKYESWNDVPRELIEESYTNGSWYNVNCILVTFNGVPQYVVDPQGYSYARYVGILESFNTIV